MRILIIKGQSQYGGTRLFADEAAAAFRRRSHEVEILDLGGVADPGQRLLDHGPATRTDLVFTINIRGNSATPWGARSPTSTARRTWSGTPTTS